MNVIELAKEAGLALTDHGHPEGYAMFCERLERFATLVRAEALEEAAKICEQVSIRYLEHYGPDECALAIRKLINAGS